jgi:hypothetical protein
MSNKLSGAQVEYLRKRVKQNMTAQRSLLMGIQNATGLPTAIDLKTPGGKDDLRVTGAGWDAWDRKNQQIRADLDPVDATAAFMAETSRAGGSRGKADPAVVSDLAAQLRAHDALRDKSVDEQRTILSRIQRIANLQGGQSNDAYERTLLGLKDDPMKVDVLHQAGIIDEKQAKLLKGEALPADELEAKAIGLPWADAIPWLKDMPAEQRLPWDVGGIALAGAGATAGSIALANMLMQQGQQQSDYNAYAAAVQSAHAY